jgi:hypothetical protein
MNTFRGVIIAGGIAVVLAALMLQLNRYEIRGYKVLTFRLDRLTGEVCEFRRAELIQCSNDRNEDAGSVGLTPVPNPDESIRKLFEE